MDRIMGVLTLKAPVYRQIAEDPAATRTAAIIVVIVSLINGFSTGFVRLDPNTGAFTTNFLGAIVGAVVIGALGLLAWVVASWILAFVAKLFGGKTDMQEMMRVVGYVAIFSLVSVLLLLVAFIPFLGCLVGIMALILAILQIIGFFVGVREAAEVSTGKAIITGIVGAIAYFFIVGIIGGAIVGIATALF